MCQRHMLTDSLAIVVQGGKSEIEEKYAKRMEMRDEYM